jgi:hypothetical protein
MSKLSRKFGVAASPVEAFLSNPIYVGGQEMTYESFLLRHMPARLARADKANQQFKDSERFTQDKAPYAMAQASIHELQKDLADMSVVVKALSKARSMADFKGDTDADYDDQAIQKSGGVPAKLTPAQLQAQKRTLQKLERWFEEEAQRKQKLLPEVVDKKPIMAGAEVQEAFNPYARQDKLWAGVAELNEVARQVRLMAQSYEKLMGKLEQQPKTFLASKMQAYRELTDPNLHSERLKASAGKLRQRG